MKFQLSPTVAVRHKDFPGVMNFYAEMMGFKSRSYDRDLGDYDADPINLFVIEDQEFSGPVMELFVGDLDEARSYLEAHGCKVLRWRGKGQDCYIQGPFGVIYNLWEA